MNTPELTTGSTVTPATRVRGVSAYQPPVPCPYVDLVLDSNEGIAADPAVLEAFRSISLDDLRTYPNAQVLEAKIASLWQIDPARVVVTNGADDAIGRICNAILEPGRQALLHSPTFEMIGRSARLAGGAVRTIEWADGKFPVTKFVSEVAKDISLAALVSPNNPTGGAIGLHDILAVARAADQVGALVMVDLAYVEFANEDPTRALLAEPNVVVVRTFSKALGLAGARIGYALAARRVASWLRAAGGPYPVSSVSVAVGAAALADGQSRKPFIENVNAQRVSLTDQLQSLGCTVLNSEANFVTAAFEDARFVHRSLQSLGISTRVFASPHELDGHLRITLPGEQASFDRLTLAFNTILQPEAILFDIDGVLANVSGSYRNAIIRTARSFGIELSPDDIALAKRAGDANNDWILTKRLIESRGVECELGEVIAEFQRWYLGSPDSPGMRESESLIPDRAVLQRLGSRCTLGVVTGRPRDEADWFLGREGISDLFLTRVCMGDGLPKPSPDPVLRALDEIGVSRAWMIGDTPDDIVAARSARVLPIGVLAPGDDSELARRSMLAAGAADVVTDLTQVEEFLS